MKIEDAPVGIVVEFDYFMNDELGRDDELMFYASHHWVDVWVGDELVYTLRPSEELGFIKTPGSKWVYIPLLAQDEGKDVRIVQTPVYENNVKSELEIYLGSSVAIYRSQLRNILPVMILCVANILIGLMLIFATVYYKKKRKEETGLFSLGMLGISLGFWQLAHNDFSPFILEGKESSSLLSDGNGCDGSNTDRIADGWYQRFT